MSWEETRDLLALVLRLEAERLVAIARVGRVAGASAEEVAEIDRDLEVAMAGLERRGVAYPGHMLAASYRLGGVEYAMLVLTMLPHHAPDALERIGDALGLTEGGPSLRHALALFAGARADPAAFRGEVERLPLVSHKLVAVDEAGRLTLSQAVAELFGFET